MLWGVHFLRTKSQGQLPTTESWKAATTPLILSLSKNHGESFDFTLRTGLSNQEQPFDRLRANGTNLFLAQEGFVV
jgi:hypothetical protein